MTDKLTSADVAKQILERFRARQDNIESFIKQLVETESPSGDAAGSKAVVDLLAQQASGISCVDSVERHEVPGFGEHVVIKAFTENESLGQVLIVGHTDTVHSLGSVAARPWRKDEDKIYGPGIFDMKASCATVLEVLRTIDALKLKPRCAITIVLTCDEEVGSQTGWPLIEQTAKATTTLCSLVMEPPAPGGRVKTGRKGTGIFSIKVEGKAAHAGLDPEKGASAILELARQTERLHAINQAGSGITLNVGVIRGGTRSNVVAAEAEGEIDIRFSTDNELQQVEKLMSSVKPIDERVKVFVFGGINRPPLERTPAVVKLFEVAKAIAAQVDFELGEAQVGGASDGNFIAALGIPVLDGLGINGDGAHANHEHILAEYIPIRGTIITGLILSQ